MAFTPYKEVVDNDFETYIIANSITLNVGDVVYHKGSAGSGQFVTGLDSTSASAYGVVMGFLGNNQTNQGTLTTTQVVAASDNQTNAKIQVYVLPTRSQRLFIADTDAATGTTTGSAANGYFNMNGSTNYKQLHEASYVVETGTQGQFYSIGVNPNSTSQVIGYFSKTI